MGAHFGALAEEPGSGDVPGLLVSRAPFPSEVEGSFWLPMYVSSSI
jgi:hypothetical protein